MMLFPKPIRPVRGTKDAKEWMAKIAELPCVICSRRPVVVHHTIMDRHAMRRSSDFETIPLCDPCHRDLHASPKAWRELNGPDHDYLPAVREAIRLAEVGLSR